MKQFYQPEIMHFTSRGHCTVTSPCRWRQSWTPKCS